MQDMIAIVVIAVISVGLGLIKYFGNVYYAYDHNSDKINPAKNAPWQWKFVEIWNCSLNFFFAGLIGYYFVIVRWQLLRDGAALSVADFALFIIFAMCLFGHFPHLIKNVTEGINAILRRVLEK